MRKQVSNNGLSVHIIAGTHGVLLAMNATENAKKGLLGFAIKRTDHTEDECYWFKNMLTFRESISDHSSGNLTSTYNSPIQKFLWGDYSAKPDHKYTYRVVPIYGKPKDLQHGSPIDVKISTESESKGTHAVYFNRGVAASQAYTRQFGNRKPGEVENRAAWKWLSRGLEEAMINFINQAKGKKWKLYASVYEFQYEPVLKAFRDALDRGVDVRIIYDKKDTKKGPGNKNYEAIQKAGLAGVAKSREANKSYISHNKFILLIEDDVPLEVWTGSTNITVGGIFGQSNVGHIVRDTGIANTYLKYWHLLYNDLEAKKMRLELDDLTPTPSLNNTEKLPAYLKPLFSPRKDYTVLDWYAKRMDLAESSVFMTSAFGLDERFEKVLEKKHKKYLTYIMLDTKKDDWDKLRKDSDVWVAFGARLNKNDSGGLLGEALTGLNEHALYLHTKFMLVDALSNEPLLITGSANFSEASTKNNDENMLLVYKDTRVADIYLCEYMRLFEHFEYRDYASTGDSYKRHYLRPDDSWTKSHYKEGSLKQKQRLLFAMKQIETIEQFTNLITSWYEENHQGFAKKFDDAIANVQTIPDGTNPNIVFDWKNATIEDLCQFFRNWYKWNPDLSTGLEYIQRFSWLYYENKEGLEFVTTNPGNLMTFYYVVLNGQKMDSPVSKDLVNKWMEELGSKMDDYVIPKRGYKSFNDFFTRELKHGKRPISGVKDDFVVVSPADAIVNMIDDNLSIEHTLLQVKTQKLNVVQLLNESEFARNFEGGTAISCILMPDVYHHYHAPVSGMVVEADENVGGNYFGIDDFPKLINGGNVGYGYDYSVFEHFRRGYLIIETQKYGYVSMIPVGLNTIASVVFTEKFKKVTNDNPVEICKGDEVGYFQYGGSLNILLFEKGCFPALRIPQGQIIGTLNEKEPADKVKIQFSF